MGYCTRFNMEVQDIDHKGYNAFKIAKYISKMQKVSDMFYVFEYELKNLLDNEESESNTECELYLESDDEYKWYDNEEDMILLSKEFPDVLFKITWRRRR